MKLLRTLDDRRGDPSIRGSLVQLPRPGHLNSDAVIQSIRPEKDVDGLHVVNGGKLAMQDLRTGLVSYTPSGAMVFVRAIHGIIFPVSTPWSSAARTCSASQCQGDGHDGAQANWTTRRTTRFTDIPANIRIGAVSATSSRPPAFMRGSTCLPTRTSRPCSACCSGQPCSRPLRETRKACGLAVPAARNGHLQLSSLYQSDRKLFEQSLDS